MGGTSWSDSSYSSFARTVKDSPRDTVFRHTATKTMDSAMNPKGLKIRECRDSNVHPETIGAIVALDVTGSMGHIPERLVKETLPNLMKTLIDNGLPDVQVLFIAIGDHYTDNFPLQVGQFESGTDELIKWLTSVNLEGGGGGQNWESYSLAWLLASKYISMDCFEKRNRKGFLFTIGDEGFHKKIEKSVQMKIFDSSDEVDLDSIALLRSAERMFEVFHLNCLEGSKGKLKEVIDQWKSALGERLIPVEDSTKIPEIIATTIAVFNNISLEDIVKSFDGSTALMVQGALANIRPGSLATSEGSVGTL